MNYLEDVLFVIGFGLITAGAYLLFGLGWCFMISGAILVSIATIGAIRRNDISKTPEPGTDTESSETQ